MIPEDITCAMMATLPDDQRRACLCRLESILNDQLASSASLGEWQTRLYTLIEELNGRGFYLGRWDYDSEIETWGGRSYMDPKEEDDLLLRSEYPKGVRLAWKRYADLE